MKTRRQQPTISPDDFDLFRHTYRYGYDWFAFYQGWVDGRKLKAHHLRDGAAFRELSVALDDRGGRYEKLFRNGPATPEKTKHYAKVIKELVEANQHPLVEEVVEYRPVDESFLKRGRLLVVPTRLPMNDFQQGDKVQVQPGFTSLEQKIIRVCRPYLPVVARSRVRVAEALAAELRPEFADRADIQFRAYEEPWYSMLRVANPGAPRRRPKRGARRTAAYLLQLPAVSELNGADLLVMWGQGGTQTLAFAQRLRSDLSYLLDQYGFSMVEMIAPESAEEPEGEELAMEPFLLLDSARDWEVHVLIEGALLDPSGRRVRPPKPVQRGKPAVAGEKPSPVKSVRPERSGVKHTGSDG